MGESLPQDPVSVQLAAIYLSAFPSCLTLTYLLERATVLATRLPMLRGERLQHALALHQRLHDAISVLWPVHPRCEDLAAIYLSAFPSCLTLTYLLQRAMALATRLPMLRGERLQHALVLNKQLHGAIWVLWPVHPRCEERSDDAVVL